MRNNLLLTLNRVNDLRKNFCLLGRKEGYDRGDFRGLDINRFFFSKVIYHTRAN